jgi:hypothetical protein
MLRAFAEHGLGRIFPERTGAAIGGLVAQGLLMKIMDTNPD